ncbi:hypothetical protein C0991_000488 [Blastosporella zonata]|nr:hypothetical protein C0991_000488 [Blastosporella zonata]
MPRWGVYPLSPSFRDVQEVLYFIHCLLKALNYLHTHRIAHADLKEDNVLVNQFTGFSEDFRGSNRTTLRSQGCLTYALFDFSLATMFPSSTSLTECRLPSSLSFRNYPPQRPSDTLQGELDYNPFAFDVGMLGVFFCRNFQASDDPSSIPWSLKEGFI